MNEELKKIIFRKEEYSQRNKFFFWNIRKNQRP